MQFLSYKRRVCYAMLVPPEFSKYINAFETNKNLTMSPNRTENKKICAGEGQQQFTAMLLCYIISSQNFFFYYKYSKETSSNTGTFKLL
jgi:hypothetical protein